jgi:hypothetical protein
MSDHKTLTSEEEAALEADFAQAETGMDNVLSPAQLARQEAAEKTPQMGDPDWSEYVFQHFTENELDSSGHPFVTGLRRVARLLLGPILKSKARVVQAPAYVPGLERVGILTPVCVQYTLQLLMCNNREDMPAYKATFTDAADVYFGNTDPDFARYSSAMAATRGEARCLRKALMLATVSSEEKTSLPMDMAAADGLIDPVQVNFISVLCARNNISVMKYINSGKKRYDRIDDVPYGVAAKMVEHLSGIQNKGSVAPELQGYEKNWRNDK